MKICPLVTQALILEGDSNVLLGETDSSDVEMINESSDSKGDIFLNPDVEAKTNDQMETKEVRFLAKSFRGEVKCLGETCRFYDDEKKSCKFEQLIESVAREEGNGNEAIESLKEEIFSTKEMLKEEIAAVSEKLSAIEERHNSLEEKLSNSEGSVSELSSKVDSSIDSLRNELKGSLEDVLGRTSSILEKLDEQMKENGERFDGFRDSISEWKSITEKNIESIETELDNSKKLLEEFSVNHSEILKMVENQKKDLEEEERKRKLAEAKRLNNSGVIHYHNGQYEKALELFKKAIELDPEFTEGYNNLGLTYTEIQEEEKATEAFKKAIELNPDLAATYNNLGYVFYRLGSYEEAIEMYNEAIGKSKDNSSAYTNLGNAYYKLDRTDEAIEAWKKALEIDPSNEKAKRNLKKFHVEV
ncbi:MAG: hypothetical protein B6D63_05615 [Candidatus Latescibacteria bacterium 4484_7]|nr:MAG: hypothetical protein B6D63_05615 [Candidatus Latescibacteria bacterium 4484_7]RKZ07092.1 MAG: hypothetical protein DRQ05_03695 [bacterium]